MQKGKEDSMKIDKEHLEINHMTVLFKDVNHDIYCSCYSYDYDGGAIPIDVGFRNFDSVESALEYGWSIKDKKKFICPDCTKELKNKPNT
jgi:hypothetical protein